MPVRANDKRGPARACADCWYLIRPDQYEPFTFIEGKCSVCGNETLAVHRVSWSEVDEYNAEVRANAEGK